MFGHEPKEGAGTSETIGRYTIRMLILVSGGAFAIFAVLFGDMLKYNCQLGHVEFLYWLLGAFIAALLVPLSIWVGEGKNVRQIVLAAAALSLVMLAVGGVQFLDAFSENQIVSCPSDSGDYQDSQHFGV